MSNVRIDPYPIVFGLDGQPLNEGYIYVGEQNQDPQYHPKTVYLNPAQTIPIAQPMRTLYGRVWNAGAPALLYITGNYSIRVCDKNGAQIFIALDVAPN